MRMIIYYQHNLLGIPCPAHADCFDSYHDNCPSRYVVGWQIAWE
jgi:hypothetical protein